MKGKIYKSVTALLSTAAMLLTYADFSVIDFTVHADSGDEPKLTDFDVNGNGKIEDEEKEWGYALDSADDLYWFADKVNNDNDNFGNANAFLACDITVNSDVLNENGGLNEGDFREWTPIGDYSFQYSGIFNGNNKTISGLYFNDSGADYVGLFGYVGTVGKIQDVTIADSYFCGRACVGGVCGSNIGGSISDCSNTGDVSGVDCVGGVCGYNKSTISNCYNKGTVTGDENVGGVCGGNNGTIKNCYNTGDVTGTDDYVGGVCGYNRGTISNCYNTGSVTGDDYVGGVCGDNSLSEISNCYNTGDVSGDDCVGGVCGDNIGTITNCYNTGDVSGDGFVGGVCGFSCDGTIENCYNTGDVTTTGKYTYVGGVCGSNIGGSISDCYNTGSVTGDAYVGGVCGDYEDGEISNCYYLDTTAGTGIGDVDDEAGSVEAKSAEQFASGEVCWLLSGEQSESPVFYQNLGTDESPVPDSTHHAVKYSETSYYNEHTDFDENGFCTICDGYQPATTVKDVYDIDGDGETSDDVYEISNAGQLYWFAGLVNGTLGGVKRISSANAVLTADITVNSGVLDENGELNEGDFRVWTPIGYYDYVNKKSYSYYGAFDGAGHTISGLYFNDSSKTNVGLFGFVSNGASENKIMNLTVSDSYFCGDEKVGGVCGLNKLVTIQNCSNTGTVRGNSYVGGVCGYISKRVIENCYNTGKVSGNSYIGGICGYNDDKNTIQNCYNTGAVSGDTIVGGICGKVNYTSLTSNAYKMVTNCYNTGKVTGNTYVGSINGSGESKLIENCYYLGTEGVSGRGGGPDSEGSTTAMSETKFKSGEVCWLLNGGETQAETPVFFQNIDKEAFPVLDSTHGRVYLTTNCVTYSNTDGNKNHAPDSCAKEATCTEDGCEAYWYCKDCGMYFSDADCTNEIEDIETWKSENAIPATGHSYKDGICEKCGAFKDGIGARLSGVSLSLDGSIGVNFYMQLAEEVLEDETAYMLFTLPNGETSEIKVSKAETKTVGGVTYYGFKCNVAATEMTDTIKAQIITVNGNGTEYSYTVKEYADYLLAHTEGNAEYAKAEELVKAMLNYGAYAQKFKEHNTDNLPCEPMDMTTYNIKAHSFTAAPSDNVEFKGANLSMLSNTTLRLFFEIDDETGVTMSYGSEKLETGKNNGLYFAEIKNIAPLNLDNDFTVLTSDGSMVTYSPLTYCYQVSQESNDAALVELVKAIALYNEAAKAYFKEAK